MRHGRLHIQQRSGKVGMEPGDRGNQLASKKTRRIIDLETKMKVIRYYESGKSVAVISRQLDMPHSTIATILRNREKVTEAAKGSASLKVTRLTKMREGPISDMENQLMSWIEEEVRLGKSLSNATIKSKAKSLFDSLKEKAGPDCDVEFSASSGWFMRFKNRYSVDSVVDSISADVKMMDEFVDTLGNVITEDGYAPERIFAIAETSMFWRRLGIPNRKSSGEAYKEKATILLGGNAAGHKLKPCVIWHSDNIDSLEEINTLPVHFKTSLKPVLTRELLQDIILKSFVPEIEKYCLDSLNKPLKFLLLVDESAGSLSVRNVKFLHLPKNGKSLSQPMDRGVISTFKKYYMEKVLTDAVAAVEESSRTLSEFWKEYTGYKFVRNLSKAWNDVPKKCMIGAWNRILPGFTIEEWNEEELTRINNTVTEMAEKVNANLYGEDADEVLEVVPEELTNVELLELESQVPEKKFTERGLSEFFKDLDKLLKKAEDMDSDSERFAVIKRNANAVFAEYREIYDESRRGTRLSGTEGTAEIGYRDETGCGT